VKTVLVVDDDHDNAEMMKLLLETHGCRVAVAYDGATSIDVAREVHPDLVLCDLRLEGEMDGFEVAATLRHEVTKPLLIAVSGYSRPEDRASALAAGFDDHLPKPVDLERLRKVLDSI
jgi:two-component system, chemotaxis family, CheB/CheR fusion protein